MRPLAALLLAAPALADTQPLSPFLGAPSGQAALHPNAPFTTLVDTPNYGLGVDCPGSWTSIPIQFSDAGPFPHGIGQHPPEFGESRVDFDLVAVQAATGRRVTGFEARIGIESVTSLAENGARFSVRLDGAEAFSLVVPGRSSHSTAISIPISHPGTLTLATTRTGEFNSNHACWALAAVTLGESVCPADFNGDGFLDFFDYDDYVNCFETGSCPPGKTADFNGDNFADFFDYDDFVAAFERGC